jgi:GNAT superfamily N-acetyltransferase
MTGILQIRPAVADDMKAIIGLIDEARAWLPSKGTDQWAKPWPNPAARNARVLRDLNAARTWLVEDDDHIPVATVTSSPEGNQRLWTPEEQAESAAYVARLVVSRRHGGERIGEALIDWAGSRAVRDWCAKWIRIDVWTTNEALHNYYEKRGFQRYGICEFYEDEYYPSAALFQKPTVEIDQDSVSRFIELPVCLRAGASGWSLISPGQSTVSTTQWIVSPPRLPMPGKAG